MVLDPGVDKLLFDHPKVAICAKLFEADVPVSSKIKVHGDNGARNGVLRFQFLIRINKGDVNGRESSENP